MIIDIRRLFDVEGEAVPLTYSLDLSDVEQWGVHPFNRPINLEGEIRNRAGIVTIAYKAFISTKIPCDRCLKEVLKEYSLNFEHTLVRKLYNEEADESYTLVEDGMLDLFELVTTDIVLELPTKNLCSENCKGLCPKCGANLNETTCNCATKEVDPRLASLLKLLD